MVGGVEGPGASETSRSNEWLRCSEPADDERKGEELWWWAVENWWCTFLLLLRWWLLLLPPTRVLPGSCGHDTKGRGVRAVLGPRASGKECDDVFVYGGGW